MKDILECPTCHQNLRVPTDKGALTIRCPKCHTSWDWSPDIQSTSGESLAGHADEDRLADMLLQWEESFEQGQDLPVEKLCRDCPNLIQGLGERIAALKRMNWVNEQSQEAGKERKANGGGLINEELGRDFERVLEKGRMDWVDKHGGETTDRGRTIRIPLHPGAEPVPGYRLIQRVGKGASGQVWSAQSPDKMVAMKFFYGEGFFSPTLGVATDGGFDAVNETFLVDDMQNALHPFILDFYDSLMHGLYPILVMELADASLESRFRELRENCPILQRYAYAVCMLRDAAEALDFLHGIGIQHLDIKPANLLLVSDSCKIGDLGALRAIPPGQSGQGGVRLSAQSSDTPDEITTAVYTSYQEVPWGQALSQGATLFTREGAFTPKYAPPEAFQGKFSRSSDQYSLALTFCELVAGTIPFTGTGDVQVKERLNGRMEMGFLPEALRPVIGKALSPQAQDRFPSCMEFIISMRDALRPLVNNDSIAEAWLDGWFQDGVSFRKDPTAAHELLKQHRIPTERAGQIVDEARQKAHPPKSEQKVEKLFTNNLGMTFAWISPGTFLMGSPKSEAARWVHSRHLSRDNIEAQHEVTLAKGFHMGVHLVTQEQWQAVMGNNPSYFEGEQNLPVEMVSWHDCQDFIKKLRDKDRIPYRLPTEAEWEYACRAGTTTPFYFGDTISTNQANYDGNHTYGNGKRGVNRQKTTPVGSFSANSWGLHDMHGNAWEWCQDWAGDYPKEYVVDPQGPDAGNVRGRRGGSWNSNPEFCRSAYRGGCDPGNRSMFSGFRLCFCLEEVELERHLRDQEDADRQWSPRTPVASGDKLAGNTGDERRIAIMKEKNREYFELCTESIGLNPNHSQAYLGRGIYYYGEGMYNQAIDDCTQAIRVEPLNSDAHCLRGTAYSRLAKYDRAIEDLTQAIRLPLSSRASFQRDQGQAYCERGAAYRDLKKYEEAIGDFSQAILLNPKNSIPYRHRGVCIQSARKV